MPRERAHGVRREVDQGATPEELLHIGTGRERDVPAGSHQRESQKAWSAASWEPRGEDVWKRRLQTAICGVHFSAIRDGFYQGDHWGLRLKGSGTVGGRARLREGENVGANRGNTFTFSGKGRQ